MGQSLVAMIQRRNTGNHGAVVITNPTEDMDTYTRESVRAVKSSKESIELTLAAYDDDYLKS